MKKLITFHFLVLFSAICMSDGWVIGHGVKQVAVKYGNGCVTLENGEIIKIDLESEAGKAEYSTALAAMMSGRSLDVYKKTSWPLSSGCDVGETITPHIMLRLNG